MYLVILNVVLFVTTGKCSIYTLKKIFLGQWGVLISESPLGYATEGTILHWLPISTRIEYKVLLIVLKAQMGVAPKHLRDAIRLLPYPFVLYAPWTGASLFP